MNLKAGIASPELECNKTKVTPDILDKSDSTFDKAKAVAVEAYYTRVGCVLFKRTLFDSLLLSTLFIRVDKVAVLSDTGI